MCECGARLTGRQKLWASEGCRKAFERGTAPANADTTRTRKPSGLQVSLPKAEREIRAELSGAVRARALAAVRRALSDRQHRILESRA